MIRFGPAGCGDEGLGEDSNSIMQVPMFIKNKNLTAYEYSFGHGYQMKTDTAEKAGTLFKEQDIKLSIHAPYYINFANPDEVMYQKSVGYIKTGIKFLKAFGYADHLVFHSGSCGKLTRDEAVNLIAERFRETLDSLEEQHLLNGILLCPETMGKPMQIGTYEEIINLCKINEHLVPTFDFGHINALTQGTLRTKQDFLHILARCIETLGFDRTNNCHIHFSKIQYGEKGEIRHLNFDDTIHGPEYQPMIEALLDLKLDNVRIICESHGMQPKDAQTMKNFYEKLLDKHNQI